MPVHGLSALPQTVDIKDAQKIIKPVMRGNLDCLPLRPFRHLAVAKKDVCPVGQLVQVFCIQRNADAD